jgi:hypothetical protein
MDNDKGFKNAVTILAAAGLSDPFRLPYLPWCTINKPMIYRLKGQVIAILKDRVALDVHDVAYEVLVSRVQEFPELRDQPFHLRSDHSR